MNLQVVENLSKAVVDLEQEFISFKERHKEHLKERINQPPHIPMPGLSHQNTGAPGAYQRFGYQMQPIVNPIIVAYDKLERAVFESRQMLDLISVACYSAHVADGVKIPPPGTDGEPEEIPLPMRGRSASKRTSVKK